MYSQMARINPSEMSVDEYFASMIPPGYRFQPTDYELLSEYLIKKIKQEPLPPNRIHVVNLYDFNPDYLTESSKPAKENEWYFFSPTDKRYKNGSRPNRTGDGYWKSTGSNEPIKHKNIIIGYKRSLVFFMGKHTDHDIKTDWLMKEYTLKNPPAPVQTSEDTSMRLNDWVICKVYKNQREQRAGKRKSNDDSVVVEFEEEVTRNPNINVVEVEQEKIRINPT
ncbi:hypothetical protein DH2020_014147 [Rehmannia glutinosa]|uniref:NAC domain-containing protein n=1 Tax=Rehmannia glutinosa TaxID=99300 RepID=A0ABR0WYN2_REHGL